MIPVGFELSRSARIGLEGKNGRVWKHINKLNRMAAIVGADFQNNLRIGPEELAEVGVAELPDIDGRE